VGCKEVEVGSRSSKESDTIRSAEEEVVVAVEGTEVGEKAVVAEDETEEEIEDLLVVDGSLAAAGTTTEDREEEVSSIALDAAAEDLELKRTSSDWEVEVLLPMEVVDSSLKVIEVLSEEEIEEEGSCRARWEEEEELEVRPSRRVDDHAAADVDWDEGTASLRGEEVEVEEEVEAEEVESRLGETEGGGEKRSEGDVR